MHRGVKFGKGLIEEKTVRPLASGSLFNMYDLFARINTENRGIQLCKYTSGWQVSIRCTMFGHKSHGPLVALSREEKTDNSALKTGKEKLVRRGVSGLACVEESRKTCQKKVFS